jgi:hypothetical protein
VNELSPETPLSLAQPILLTYAAPPEPLRQPAAMLLIGALAATCGWFQLRGYDPSIREIDFSRLFHEPGIRDAVLVDPTASIALAIYAMVVAFVLFRNRPTARRHTLWLAVLTIAHEVYVYVTALHGYGFNWSEDGAVLGYGFLQRMIFPMVLLILVNLPKVRRYESARRAAQTPAAR